MYAYSEWILITPDNLPENGDLVLSSSCDHVMKVNFDTLALRTTYEWWIDPVRSWKWKAKFIVPREMQVYGSYDAAGEVL